MVSGQQDHGPMVPALRPQGGASTTTSPNPYGQRAYRNGDKHGPRKPHAPTSEGPRSPTSPGRNRPRPGSGRPPR